MLIQKAHIPLLTRTAKEKMAHNECGEGSDMFDSDGKQTREWSHGKPSNATDNKNCSTILKSVSLLKSERPECKKGCRQKKMWNELDKEFQCLDKGNDTKSVTANNQEGEFGIEEIDLEA